MQKIFDCRDRQLSAHQLIVSKGDDGIWFSIIDGSAIELEFDNATLLANALLENPEPRPIDPQEIIKLVISRLEKRYSDHRFMSDVGYLWQAFQGIDGLKQKAQLNDKI